METYRSPPSRSALFAVFVVTTAVYFAGLMYLALRFDYESRVVGLLPLQLLGWVVPAIACGAVQHSVSRRAGVAPSRVWTEVAVGAVGAPLVGVLLVLFVFLVSTTTFS